MKTTLLFVLALVIGFSVSAQKAPKAYQKAMKPAMKQLNVNLPTEKTVQPGTTKMPAAPSKSAVYVEKVSMGSSVNAYSVLLPTQHGLSYNPETGVIMHDHRGDHVTPGYGHGNDVNTAWSTDGGSSFIETTGFLGSTTNRCRYPSGVIYNPAGNTDPNNVYSIVAGPITNGSGWVKTFYGSTTMAGLNVDQQFYNTTANGEIIRDGMSVCDNGLVAIGTVQNLNDGNGYTDLFGFTSVGMFNGTTNLVDWDLQTWNPEEYIYFDATNGWYRSWSSSYNMCFSKDGSIGYRWTDGIDNRATNGSSFYPIVYKTTDGGATWNVLDYFDFGQLPEIYPYLVDLSAEAGRVAPWFHETAGVVDFRGNLHLFGVCTSAVSLHPDSLTYYYPTEMGIVFDFEYINDANTWMGSFVDTLRTEGPTSGSTGNSIYGTGDARVGWDMRLQATMSPDGKKVFATWTDTDDPAFWGLSETLNMYPDLKVWGLDVPSRIHTAAKNMTYEDGAGEAWGECYFEYTAPISIAGDGVTTIPVSICDIATNDYDPDLPIFHYYLKGVDISDADFIYQDAPEATKVSSVVSSIYPNPVAGVANFNVNLVKSANVMVTISSVTGQQVASTNYGKLASGINTLQLDATNFSSGIYFYTVSIDGQKYTNKFIVK